jgi:hypothetical protein
VQTAMNSKLTSAMNETNEALDREGAAKAAEMETQLKAMQVWVVVAAAGFNLFFFFWFFYFFIFLFSFFFSFGTRIFNYLLTQSLVHNYCNVCMCVCLWW